MKNIDLSPEQHKELSREVKQIILQRSEEELDLLQLIYSDNNNIRIKYCSLIIPFFICLIVAPLVSAVVMYQAHLLHRQLVQLQLLDKIYNSELIIDILEYLIKHDTEYKVQKIKAGKSLLELLRKMK